MTSAGPGSEGGFVTRGEPASEGELVTSGEPRWRHVVEAMGTVFSFDVRGVARESFGGQLAEAVALLHRVDEVFSTYRPDSDVSRLARGEVPLERCAPEVREVLELCDEAEAESGGWFTARYCGAWDPTGLVKGWAVERAARLLRERGASSVCLNGGGDVQVFGGPWRIGVTDPLRPGNLIAVVAADGPLAVATSGPSERGCHILDPHTGAPPAAGLASVTVVSTSLTAADAWATAAYAMGDRARGWLEGRPSVEALAVTVAGDTWRTSGFDALGSLLR